MIFSHVVQVIDICCHTTAIAESKHRNPPRYWFIPTNLQVSNIVLTPDGQIDITLFITLINEFDYTLTMQAAVLHCNDVDFTRTSAGLLKDFCTATVPYMGDISQCEEVILLIFVFCVWGCAVNVLVFVHQIYIPVNLDRIHWFLLVVDIPKKRFAVLDSMCPKRHKHRDENVKLLVSVVLDSIVC